MAVLSLRPKTLNRRIKPLVFLLLAGPLIWLAWQWYLTLTVGNSALGFQPIEATNRFTGDWAFYYLMLGLALTPLSKLIKSPLPVAFRRMVGLFAFSLAALHISHYIAVDQYFNWPVIWDDIVKRPFITVGMISFLLLLPLALTSTKKMVKRLGAKRWQKLHKLVYLIVPLVLVHYWMMLRGQRLEPWLWMALIIFLLLFRVNWKKLRQKQA